MSNSNRENKELIEKLKEHQELILAILSGIIIFFAWRMD